MEGYIYFNLNNWGNPCDTSTPGGKHVQHHEVAQFPELQPPPSAL